MASIALRRRTRAIWQKLSHLDARPDQIAAGFAIGIAAGFLPLNPSPIVVATAAAWLLARNVSAAIAGAATAILYTPLLPLVWLAEYRLGASILPVRPMPALDRTRLWTVLHDGWDVYAAMLVGSFVIAAPVAALAYLAVRRLAERWVRRKNESRYSE